MLLTIELVISDNISSKQFIRSLNLYIQNKINIIMIIYIFKIKEIVSKCQKYIFLFILYTYLQSI